MGERIGDRSIGRAAIGVDISIPFISCPEGLSGDTLRGVREYAVRKITIIIVHSSRLHALLGGGKMTLSAPMRSVNVRNDANIVY